MGVGLKLPILVYARFEKKIREIPDKVFQFQRNKEFCAVVCEMKGKLGKIFLEVA